MGRKSKWGKVLEEFILGGAAAAPHGSLSPGRNMNCMRPNANNSHLCPKYEKLLESIRKDKVRFISPSPFCFIKISERMFETKHVSKGIENLRSFSVFWADMTK